MGWKPIRGEIVTHVSDSTMYEVICIANDPDGGIWSRQPQVIYKDEAGIEYFMELGDFVRNHNPFGCVRDSYVRHEWVHSVLKRARESYGNKDQVAVACEELNELAGVLCKYQRYDSHEAAIEGIKSKVVEEIGDVEIVLNHLYAIFDVDKGAVLDSVMRKVDRLERWLDSGKTLEQSTKDRELKEVGAVNGIEGI